MATPDHTVPARPSLPPDGIRTPAPGRLHSPGTAKVGQPRPSTRDGISMAVYALTRLLTEHVECQQALDHGSPMGLSPWPLPPMYKEGLTNALYYLNQYARLLGREPRVTA